ncbi:type II secretion system F family protein [Halofilum ochraceum]|uniref:type II secretion system F family protein n=1 Tax=Halofilum ochraceum TaxID=1611323 RepID=UPI0008D91AF7|nr:type II secretion system F family protein [Halofilum ochraceum]
MAEAATSKKTIFDWEGKDAKGNRVKGQMEGPNADWVKAQIRRKGTTPVKVRKQSKSLFSGGGKKIRTEDIAIFARQLATMLSAGVPLVQAFDIVGNGHENPSMRDLILRIKTDIEGGSNLSQALAQHPNHFDDLFVNLVAAGEQSGTLETLLDKIATYKEKSEALKAKIKKAMYYPAAVLIVAFVVTAILLMYVVPMFESLFSGIGGGLPAFTQFVVDLSEAFQQYWYIIFGSIAAVIIGFLQAHKKSRKFRDRIDALVLKLPILGDIAKKAAIARFARTLSTMSTAGVPLVEAMESVAETVGNAVFRRGVYQMRDEASSGQQLQAAMAQTNLFPNMVVQMTAIGEESGSLDGMLAKVADFYEQEVDNAVDSLTSLMEPIIMSFLGIVIGGLVIAMYLPIFQMGQAF